MFVHVRKVGKSHLIIPTPSQFGLIIVVSLCLLSCGGGGGGGGTSGTRVVFASNYQTPATMNLYIGIAGSSNPTRLTFAAGDNLSPYVAANKLTFVSTRNGAGELFLMNLDATNLVRITNNVATTIDDDHPHLNSAGTQIVFTRNDGSGQGDIYKVSPNGSGLTQLTFDAKSFMPCWNPTGNKIVFCRQATTVELWTMDSDGSNQTMLQTGLDYAIEPDWRGSMIAFVGTVNSAGGVFVVPDTGGVAARLTTGQFQWAPRISPNGSYVIYGENGPLGDNNIYRVPVSNPQQGSLFIDLGAQESIASFTE